MISHTATILYWVSYLTGLPADLLAIIERLTGMLCPGLSSQVIAESLSQLSLDTMPLMAAAIILSMYPTRTIRPRKIVFIGQSHWVKVLVAQLDAHETPGPLLKCTAVPINGPFAVLRFGVIRSVLEADVLVRVGFRPMAETRNGRLFEIVWWLISHLNPTAKQVLYWLGTDVLQAKRMLDAGINRSKFRHAATNYRHLAGAPNLVTSLGEAGVKAKLQWFPGITLSAPAVPPPYPVEFRLLTYIPDSRPNFYGGPQIIHLAKALEKVKVTVVGGYGDWLPIKPDNVDFVGWAEDMTEHYTQAVVVVRMVEHDALGGTVIEGMLFGRRVIYSRELENSIHVEFSDADTLIRVVAALLDDFEKGELKVDTATARWASETFCQKRRIEELRQFLLEP